MSDTSSVKGRPLINRLFPSPHERSLHIHLPDAIRGIPVPSSLCRFREDECVLSNYVPRFHTR
jgi:hypothetical protein